MSRGLGKVQRALLDALEASPGGDHVAYATGRRDVWLAPGIHDLQRLGKALGDYRSSAWQASFSRAAAGLAARGCIRFPPLVRIIDSTEDAQRRVHHLADGDYVDQPKRRRFVSVVKSFTTLNERP
jgi:hypothetical protein